MNISHIEHVGIAVTSLEEAIPFYENMLGIKCFAIEEVADQKVKTAFFKVGQTKIELLEATAPESAIAKFIEKNGGRGGIQHIAFAIEDGVANALAEVQEKGGRFLKMGGEPGPGVLVKRGRVKLIKIAGEQQHDMGRCGERAD